VASAFVRSRGRFDEIVGWLGEEETAGLEQAQLEARLEVVRRELVCALLQDHLGLRAARERRVDGSRMSGGWSAGRSRLIIIGRFRRCSVRSP
jgi:hypothetical protein